MKKTFIKDIGSFVQKHLTSQNPKLCDYTKTGKSD